MESCPSGRRSTIGNRVDGQRRLEGSNPSLSAIIHSLLSGPLVKRLRHRPFTAVTRVRIPYGSPFNFLLQNALKYNTIVIDVLIPGGLAQLGEHLPYKQGVAGSSPASSTIFINLKTYFYIVAGWSSLVARRAHNPKVAGSNPAPATKLFFSLHNYL